MGMFQDVGMADIERDNRQTFVEVHLKSLHEDNAPFYVFSEDDENTPHDLGQYFEFIDTGRLACGRVVEITDDTATLTPPKELPEGMALQVCAACQQALIDWDNLSPDQRLIRQVAAALEGTILAKRAHVTVATKATEMIINLAEDPDSEDADEIYEEIHRAHLLHKHHGAAVDDFDKLMRKATKKFASWGYENFPSELNELSKKQQQEYNELEKQIRACFGIIAEYLRERREELQEQVEVEEPRRPAAPQPPHISREERLARRQAEREERERRAAENQQPMVRKPLKRNRKLERAITAVQNAEKEERVEALHVLRQVALESGNDEWASYAKRELKGTRDCSS